MKKQVCGNLDNTSKMLEYFLMLQKIMVEKVTGLTLPSFALNEQTEETPSKEDSSSEFEEIFIEE